MRISSRSAMIPLACFVIVLLALGLWFLQRHHGDMQKEMRSDLRAIAQLKIREIQSWRRERLADAGMLAEDPSFVAEASAFLHSSTESGESLRSRFRRLIDYYAYADVLLVAPGGRVQLSMAKPAMEGQLLHTPAAIQQALKAKAPYFIDLHESEIKNAPHISVVAALRTEEGEAFAALVLVSNASQFLFPMLQEWPTESQTAETLLIRRDGDHVLFLNELRGRKNTALTFRLPLSQNELLAAKAVQGKQGWMEGRDYRGEPVLAVVTPVPDSPWHMVAKIDMAEALAILHWDSFMILFALAGLIALLWLATLLFFTRREVRHYQQEYRTEAQRNRLKQRHSITLQSIGDAVIATDAGGRIELINPVAERLTGWSRKEALGQASEAVFKIVNEGRHEAVESPIDRVFREGVIVGLANHTLLITKEGKEIPIADSGAPIWDAEQNKITGAVLVFRDQSAARRAQERERHLQNTLRGIRRVNQLIVKEDDPLRLIDKACDHLTESFGYSTAWVALLGDDGQKVEHVSGYVLGQPVNTLRAGLSAGQPLPACAARALRKSGELHVAADHSADCGSCPLDCGSDDDRTTLSQAMVSRERVIAVLCASVPRHYGEDAEVRSLFQEVVLDLTFALQKITTRESLERIETEYRELFEATPIGIFRTTARGKVGRCNPAMARIVGASSPEEAKSRYSDLGRQLYVCHERRQQFLDMLKQAGAVENFEYEAKTLDDRTIWLNTSAHRVESEEAEEFFIEGFVTEVTRRKQAEQERDQMFTQLAQAERMNAVGRLAGGVAHDFNNLLMGIMNYVDLCREALDPESKMREWLDQVMEDSKRSANLIRQLLAFARKQNIVPQVLDLNDTIAGMLKMLRRLIGEDIELVWRPASSLYSVYLDASQLDQILANLAVNARDAIGGVGNLSIETQNVHFGQQYCENHSGFLEGDFAMLAISDDGCGMDEETVDQVFEPFFTTKPVGEGTGLGLATVYGIVKQNDGFINVYSEPGQGTTLRIYLPRHGSESEAVKPAEQKEEVCGGTEKVLLVEDELSVRKTTGIFLQRLGYAVIPAQTPQEALELAEETSGGIDLLITDVVMPGMSGRDLATQLAAEYPRLKCLYMSGYTANVIAHRGILEKDVAFLGKPFTRDELARKVRQVLGANSTTGTQGQTPA